MKTDHDCQHLTQAKPWLVRSRCFRAATSSTCQCGSRRARGIQTDAFYINAEGYTSGNGIEGYVISMGQIEF
jgi:hypothetical protein